jgi:16S rRNA (guanine527-N7)-methyltransferase
MEQYLEILLDWNTRLNLSAVRDPGEVLIKHFLDSLAILRHLPPEAPLLDIGTGAGFPGLVVKILRPDQPVTLAESRAKKVGFLEHVRRTLALRECSILHQRVIPGDPALVGQFGAVVSRAFQSLEPFIELAHPFLQPGGRVIAMLGRALPGGEKGVQALASASGATLTALEQFALPLGAGERHIVVLEWTEARCST